MNAVTFPNGSISMAGNLFVPPNFDPQGSYAALVNAMAANRLHVQAGSVELDTALHAAADGDTNARVGAAYRSKYAGGGGALTTMVTAPALATTVKLVG